MNSTWMKAKDKEARYMLIFLKNKKLHENS
jgi:hypothetical protein